VPGIAVNPRPSLPEFFTRFEHSLDIDEELRGPIEEGVIHRWPVDVDPNLLTGHPSITRHSDRLSCKDFVAGGRLADPTFVLKLDRGPWCFVVMAAGCCSKQDRQMPGQVDKNEAILLVDLLLLPPSTDHHEAWLMSKGLLRDGHLSWTKFTGLFKKYSVARVDTRLVDSCKEHPELWAMAVVDVTGCDQYLNAFNCEHCLVARHLFRDPLADPSPSSITTAASADGATGAPLQRVLGSCRMPGA